MPWIRLYAEGEPVEDIFAVIRANVRIPREMIGDLSAQVAACHIGDRSLQELARRHGPARLASLMADLLDHTEQLLRREIASWPDGTVEFTDYMDSDGIDVCDVPMRVALTVRGDELVADFSDSAPMVRGALNCTPSFVAGRRLPHGDGGLRDRHSPDGGRNAADHGDHEARHGDARRSCRARRRCAASPATASPT